MGKSGKDLLSYCSEIDFGAVTLSEGERDFLSKLNDEMILLCKSLPESTQADALIFLMEYSRISIGEPFDFFRNYYAPAWSIIYWLDRSTHYGKRIGSKDIEHATTAHSMAMFLHSLDDHLNDNELPVTHLSLLLRSQSWMTMNNALNSLADGVNGGREIVRGFIDDYYSGVRKSDDKVSLDGYCDLFRNQMATGFIVPVLMTKKMVDDEEFAQAVQTAYGSFGIAWRLLDDIRDMETDMMKGAHSAIYICLPEKIRNFWDNLTAQESHGKNDSAMNILDCILANSVIERIRERICRELESAVSIADSYVLKGLADEFRCLLRPLMNGQEYL